MPHANLQDLQAAERQLQRLLLHVGQRQLPALPPAPVVPLLVPRHRLAPVRGSLHPHGEPAARRRPPLVSLLLHRPRAGHELHSGVRQVRSHVTCCQLVSHLHTGLTESLSSSVLYFLGYSNEEMEGRSWYSLVHPEDLSSSAEFHQNLGKYSGIVMIQGSHEGFLMI